MLERLRYQPALTSRNLARRRRSRWLAGVLLCWMRDGTAARKRARSPADSQLAAIIPICRFAAASLCSPARRMRQGFPAARRPQATRMSTGCFLRADWQAWGVMHMQGPPKAPLPTA